MAYFPMFVDVSDKKILVVGGGKVAARRIKTLRLFTDEVTVLSPRLCQELEPLPEGVNWIAREYGAERLSLAGEAVGGEAALPESNAEMGEVAVLPESNAVVQDDAELMEVDVALAGKDFVLAATNRREVNKKIFEDCRLLEAHEGRKILVNCADDKSHCDFFFPAVVQSDEITVGINSGGRNTKKVREIREKVEKVLKDNMDRKMLLENRHP